MAHDTVLDHHQPIDALVNNPTPKLFLWLKLSSSFLLLSSHHHPVILIRLGVTNALIKAMFYVDEVDDILFLN
jgi:hypothetical protein